LPISIIQNKTYIRKLHFILPQTHVGGFSIISSQIRIGILSIILSHAYVWILSIVLSHAYIWILSIFLTNTSNRAFTINLSWTKTVRLFSLVYSLAKTLLSFVLYPRTWVYWLFITLLVNLMFAWTLRNSSQTSSMRILALGRIALATHHLWDAQHRALAHGRYIVVLLLALFWVRLLYHSNRRRT
jgi:hypothetical protein